MEKLNIAELLKDCPSGMELDCLLWDNVTFERVADNGIWIKHIDSKSNEHSLYVYNDGSFPIHNLASLRTKCIIFPKGKTTWDGFQRPFKDGDVLFVDCSDDNEEYKNCQFVFILNKSKFNSEWHSYCHLDGVGNFEPKELYITDDEYHPRFATKEEKRKLFDVIKANGYRWNIETKTLEKLIKPKFNIGDTITNGKTSITIGYIDNEYYYEIGRNISNRLFIKNQDEWNLVPNKFDITTLKPFESKVLVRDVDYHEWEGAIFGRYDGKKFFTIGGLDWECCIPYKGNEHLLGTTGDCDDYYKIWK